MFTVRYHNYVDGDYCASTFVFVFEDGRVDSVFVGGIDNIINTMNFRHKVQRAGYDVEWCIVRHDENSANDVVYYQAVIPDVSCIQSIIDKMAQIKGQAVVAC